MPTFDIEAVVIDAADIKALPGQARLGQGEFILNLSCLLSPLTNSKQKPVSKEALSCDVQKLAL